MQDHDTRCVHRLSDLTNARLSRPKVAYTEVGKVKRANNLCLVIDLVQSDTYHARRSTAPVPGLNLSAPIHLVQATLGHASVSTTGRYLHARPTESSSFYLPD